MFDLQKIIKENNINMTTFKFSDAVSMRMIQIFQESVIFGVDGADLFRQVKLIPDENDPETLVLDPSYIEEVSAMHEKYLKDAQELRAQTF